MITSLYSKNNNRQYVGNDYILRKFKHLLRWSQEEAILEIGPGDGKSTKELLMPILPETFREYVGIDISKNNIEHLRENINDQRCKFYELDIGSDFIPEEFENRFDHIFSFVCLHWVKDSRKAVENMKKMLKPGGQLFLTMLVDGLSDKIYFELSEIPRWKKYNHKNHVSTLFEHKSSHYFEKWKNLFNDANLKVEFCVSSPSTYKFSNKQLEGFIAGANPLLSTISNEDFSDYLSDYLRICKEICVTESKEDIFSIVSEMAFFFGSRPY